MIFFPYNIIDVIFIFVIVLCMVAGSCVGLRQHGCALIMIIIMVVTHPFMMALWTLTKMYSYITYIDGKKKKFLAYFCFMLRILTCQLFMIF